MTASIFRRLGFFRTPDFTHTGLLLLLHKGLLRHELKEEHAHTLLSQHVCTFKLSPDSERITVGLDKPNVPVHSIAI